jgi:aspartate aminotransferase-like enzyme
MQAGILVEAYAGTQKCLSAPPGLAPITFTNRAVAAVKARKAPIQSWFLDLGLMLGYWEGKVLDPITTPPRSMCFTACTRALPACLAKAWRPPGRATAPPMIGWSNG